MRDFYINSIIFYNYLIFFCKISVFLYMKKIFYLVLSYLERKKKIKKYAEDVFLYMKFFNFKKFHTFYEIKRKSQIA